MNKVDLLIQSYRSHIALPWKPGLAAAQRVIFCVYNASDELRLQAKIGEFEITTVASGYRWELFDLTDTFARWITSQKYAKHYFAKPDLLASLLPKYASYISQEFETFLSSRDDEEGMVVALAGVSSLFGFLKVKDVIDRLAPMVHGRLLVFFPGSYEHNNYRLLDAYDGWNYLAVPITADREV